MRNLDRMFCVLQGNKAELCRIYHEMIRSEYMTQEVIRYNKDKEQLKRIMEDKWDTYSNLDGDTVEMLKVMAGMNILEEYDIKDDRKERYSMIKAFEDYRLEGKIEGKIEDILELLEEFGQVPGHIVELISAEDDPSVLSRWHKSAAKAVSIEEFEANM